MVNVTGEILPQRGKQHSQLPGNTVFLQISRQQLHTLTALRG
jgi:hypothetical protein